MSVSVRKTLNKSIHGLVQSLPRTWSTTAVALALVVGVAAADGYGIGTPATPEQIAGWDIDIRPDGLGLPPGQGIADDGEAIYVEKCAACHGEFGEGSGRYPALMGGVGSLTRDRPVKTVGSYWPYATTVFDYVRRAMPFGHAQSLSDDEAYAVTAYVLYLNDIIGSAEVMNATTLPAVRMPNRDGFIADDRPDTPLGEPCMRDCRGEAKIVGKARVIDVTPQEEAAPDNGVDTDADAAARGKTVFQQCAACHSLKAGENLVGPSLYGVFGRKAASVESYGRYSTAMRAAGVVWDEDTLARFLTSPQGFVAGTSMPFAGIADADRLRELLAYLRAATAP